MELKWLEDFACLADHRSFSRAANERNVTQSALSKRIKQLEDWVGLPLIDRTSNPIGLSEAGHSFLPRAQEMIRLMRNTRQELNDRHAAKWEVLSFATLNSLSLTFFPSWIARIEAQGWSFRTRFTDPHASFIGNISTLINGQSDFFLTYSCPDIMPVEELERFPFLKLGDEPVIAVSAVGPDGKALHCLRRSPASVDYLSYRGNSFFCQALSHMLSQKDFRLNMVYENGMSVALKAMAVSGHGVAWLPQSLVTDELKRGILVRAGDGDSDLATEIRIYRTPAFRNHQAERFWHRASQLAASGKTTGQLIA